VVPNARYVYTFVATNIAGTQGPVVKQIVYTPSTLVSTVDVSNMTSTSCLVTMDGTYEYVKIYRNTIAQVGGGEDVVLLLQNAFRGASYQDNDLTPNTVYTYTIVPFNRSHVEGTTRKTSNVVSSLSELSVSIASKTSTSITYQFTGNYTTVVVYNSNGTPFIVTSTQESTYTLSSLMPNTGYKYAFLPVNRTDAVGGTRLNEFV
jgi:hypothetical protein